jgi:hypothetical protein
MMAVSAIMARLRSSGTGSEVMRRIDVPMVGGMVSSRILTLLVIPAINAIAKGWQVGRAATTANAAVLAALGPSRCTPCRDIEAPVMYAATAAWLCSVQPLLSPRPAAATHWASVSKLGWPS